MKFYTSIDEMPIFNWFKCVENAEYSWCLQKRKELNESEAEKCKAVFDSLYAQFIDRFGINETLKEIIALQNGILVHKIDLALTGDRTNKMFISIKQLELNKLLSVKQTKTNTSKIAIEKYLGCQIDTKKTTVTEYYDYLETIKQESNGG